MIHFNLNIYKKYRKTNINSLSTSFLDLSKYPYINYINLEFHSKYKKYTGGKIE